MRFKRFDLNTVELPADFPVYLVRHASLAPYIRTFDVMSYEEALLVVDGKFQRPLSKGTYYFVKNDITVEVLKADMRQLQLEVSGQEILTRDKAALRVNFYAQYQVTDVEKALLDAKDFEKQLYILIQLALREFVGTLTLDELLDNKEAVGNYVAENLSAKSNALGVQLLDSGIRDIILPGDVKEIMKPGCLSPKSRPQANTISRREETASTRSLLNTAKLMEEKRYALQIERDGICGENCQQNWRDLGFRWKSNSWPIEGHFHFKIQLISLFLPLRKKVAQWSFCFEPSIRKKMKNVISTEKRPIKLWLTDIEEGALDQAKNLANLPFTFKHIPLMPDSHQGYGMPIGSILATKGVIVPNAVGVDIGCGMCAQRTSIEHL